MPTQLIAKSFSWLFWLLLLSMLFATAAFAADLSFDVRVTAKDESVAVSLKNTGLDVAKDISAVVSLGTETYTRVVAKELPANETLEFTLTVKAPPRPGTYTLVTKIYYLNGNARLSLLNVGYFNYKSDKRLITYCELPNINLGNETVLSLRCDKSKSVKLLLPDEVQLVSEKETATGREYLLKNLAPNFRATYTYYAVLENDPSVPLHASAIFSATMNTRYDVGAYRSSLAKLFGTFAVLGFVFSFVVFRLGLKRGFTEANVALTRWSFSVFVVSALLTAYQLLYHVADYGFTILNPNWFSAFAFTRGCWLIIKTLLEWLYFRGTDYDYFSSFVVLPLFFYMLLGNYFVLRYLIKPQPESDKYWNLMLAVFSLMPGAAAHPRASRPLAKLAALSLLVKIFYVPLLSSWMLNNIFYQAYLLNNFEVNFKYINRVVLATMILIDVSIFAFGYLVELPQLKNQIRSVEPTLLGWIVCLMCYPPFNIFSFKLFDQPLQDHWMPLGESGGEAAAVICLLLWFVYVWASVVLGAKASNLTNRGIVARGPYRFVRHPAYIAKVLVWTVESFFTGSKNFFLILSLVAVYGLRAWTEERHLSRDPDYIAYKAKVRWCFIPRVF